MSRIRLSSLVGAVLVGFLLLFPAASSANDVDRSAVVDGMVVYLGIMPANMLSEHPDRYGAHNIQCPVPSGSNVYHVMIVLLDKSNGQHIADAIVRARVSPLGLVGRKKKLGAITVADAVAYCNYFKMSTNDTYNIDVQIRRPGEPSAVHTKFAYTLFRD